MHGSHAAAGFAAYDTMRRAGEAYSRHPLEAQDSLVLHNSLAASPASVALDHQVRKSCHYIDCIVVFMKINRYVAIFDIFSFSVFSFIS